MALMVYFFHKMDCGLLIVMFLSAVWTLILMAPIHSHPLVKILFIQMCSDEETTWSAF